jgi:alanine dehydrogenase
MLILNRDDVRKALPMREAIEAMRWAYAAWSTGQTTMPPRLHLHLPEGDAVSLIMPAYASGSPDGRLPPALMVKAVSVFPQNPVRNLPLVQGAALVLDPTSGQCLALLDGAALTAIRTGAGSGVATDLLARPEANSVAIFGAGAQAETQLQAVCAVRAIQTVWLINRTHRRAEAMAARWAGRDGIPANIHVVTAAAEALQETDIVCTATSAQHPLFEDADLKPGTHINAVGAYRPEMCEVPSETIARSRVFVDNRAATLSEAGDLVQAIRAGRITSEHIAGEIGEVITEKVTGRGSEREITLFKSVGMAVQDAVAAVVALRHAERQGIGQRVDWPL